MEHNPSLEAASISATQEIYRLLWNTKVHPQCPLVPILSHMHTVHNFPPYFPKIYSNINFLSKLTSSE